MSTRKPAASRPPTKPKAAAKPDEKAGRRSPPSRRVVRTQFFPRRGMHARALAEAAAAARPRTATLRADVGARAPSPEYEDDFDSYESESEASSGSASAPEEGGGPDSGHFELPEARHRQMLDNIRESIERENATFERISSSKQPNSFSDEGYEEGKSSIQFINFLEAQKTNQQRKILALRRQRGEDILSMINLDTFSFTLLDLKPVPYEDYVKTFNSFNSRQGATQTGDDSQSQEAQTNSIETTTKWTQYPPKLVEEFDSSLKNSDISLENTNDDDCNVFMANTGRFVDLFLSVKNEKVRLETTNLPPFSKSCARISAEKFGSKIGMVAISEIDSSQFLTVHFADFDKCTVCVWSIEMLGEPINVLETFGTLTCVTFGSNVLFGGIDNGSAVFNRCSGTTCRFMSNLK